MRSQEWVARSLADVPVVESIVGVFVSQDGPVATVDVAGRRLSVKAATQLRVLPSDPVRLERRGPDLVVVGPTVNRATLGKVTVDGNPATVEYPDGSGVTAELPVVDGLTVEVDDPVIIDWSSGGTVLAVVASPTATETPDAPAGSGQTVTVQLFADQSGSYGSSWWTDEVWASSSYVGGWFYGTKIKDSIPDGAVILAASIYLPAKSTFGDSPNFGIHNQAVRPAGSLTVSSTVALSPRVGEVPLPTSWFDTLKASDGGVGVNHGGRNVYRSVGADGNSGRLTVTYRT
ncbi:hypothetical protein IT882_04410 [Microbacterium schleiferi]|uniref:Uncharacterized protein n=1 Tax=Microbacterium schleiferi TaxID=69362 RepID=A0A7S8RI32_9MICO|nr:hypothetical protein [Microbacterium schleiferi]QPE05317.1 hypothetical protein IT882_04410 [Microbacterium schleiferi]